MGEHDGTVANDAYTGVAVAIFVIVSFTFLFPCNLLIPLDRRTVAVVGALACYLTRRFLFPSSPIDIISAIDFDVMVLLASIMIVNHIVVHLKETKKVIVYLQTLVQENPEEGFWMISLASFVLSPFLTNDGVCLLFVEPILNAFESTILMDELLEDEGVEKNKSKLQTSDAVYFLLALACSSNIGSALTYTGNPQNMIVATDSIGVMPSYKFLLYMLLPSVLAWLATTKWIQHCWRRNRAALQLEQIQQIQLLYGNVPDAENPQSDGHETEAPTKVPFPTLNITWCGCDEAGGIITSPFSPSGRARSPMSPASRRRARPQKDKLMKRVVRVVASPFPYMVLILLAVMIVMIFVDIMPISGLICVCAITMVVCVVVGNHWRDQMVWDEAVQDDGVASQGEKEVTIALVGARGNVYHRASDSNVGMPALVPEHRKKRTLSSDFGVQQQQGVSRQRSRRNTASGNHAASASAASASHMRQPSREHFFHVPRTSSQRHLQDESPPSHARRHSQSSQQATNSNAAVEMVHNPAVTSQPAVAGSSSSLQIATDNNDAEVVSSKRPHNHQEEGRELSREDKLDNLNLFFEELFGSIDYSLLLIFMGLFVVVENMASTGIPKFVWDRIVGKVPFSTFGSVVGISVFVLVSSQLLGNVAVIQLAKPNIEALDDGAKRYAWAVLSYVATVGGNLTITGSAANIIVVEKAARLDSNMSIDFFRHFRVCFWITLACCAVGGAIVSAIVQVDNATGSNW